MKHLYTSMVRPHLELGNGIWHPQFKKDRDLMEKVQHRATRLVPTLSKLRNEERLRQVDLPSLFYRRLRVDLIETYKHSTYTAFTRLIVEPCLHWHWKVMEWLLVGTAWSYERENIARLWEPMYFVFVLFIFATLCLHKGLFLLHLSTVSRDVLMKNMLICVTVRI